MGFELTSVSQSNPPLGIFSLRKSVISTLALLFVVALSFMIYDIFHKTVTLTVDGETREVSTFVGTVGDLLREEGINYTSHDRISFQPNEPLKDNMGLVLNHRIPVQITADGKTLKVLTHQETVAGVLKENHVLVGTNDQAEPNLKTKIEPNMQIRVIRAVPVNIESDGKKLNLETTGKTVGEALDEHHVNLGPHDKVSPSPDTDITPNIKIVVLRAVPVHIAANGKTEAVITYEQTVDKALGKLGIKLGSKDRVQPARTAKIEPNTTIYITRVQEVVEEKIETINFGVIQKLDPKLKAGLQKVMQQGQNGEVKHLTKVTLENGKEVKREKAGTEIVKKKLDKVVAIGTLKATPGLVSRGGFSFMPRKVIKNVELTAYAAGTRTATGTRVGPGRTIAVDPRVIPLGWWVWIEGVGLRKAEDTGGAVKGNIIDVYIPSQRSAIQFGRKRGATVYVIGPNRP